LFRSYGVGEKKNEGRAQTEGFVSPGREASRLPFRVVSFSKLLGTVGAVFFPVFEPVEVVFVVL